MLNKARTSKLWDFTSEGAEDKRLLKCMKLSNVFFTT